MRGLRSLAIAAIALQLPLVASVCSGSPPVEGKTAAVPRAAVMAVPAGRASPAVVPSPPPSARYASLSAACDAVGRVLRRHLGVPVRREDGATLRDWSPRVGQTGCRLSVEGKISITPEPAEVVQRRLEEAGWRPVPLEFSADGPDGSDVGIRSQGTLCILYAHWDGGDDSDPSYVPGDWYRVEMECSADVAKAE